MIDQVPCLTNRRTYEQVSSPSPAAAAWLHAGRSFNLRHSSEVEDFQILGEFPFSNGAISWRGAKVAELIQLPDTQLLETFYPPTTKAYQEPDWVEVHKKLARRNAMLKLWYDAYKSQVVRRAYTYTSFCRR